ncbi:MAG: hypothetical protein ACYDCK_11775 [Thermoplasmatota archaeon]
MAAQRASVALGNSTGVVAWLRAKANGTDVRVAWDNGTAWSAPRSLAGTGANAMVWAAAAGNRTAVAWLHADAQSLPENVTQDTPWTLDVALGGRMAYVNGAWRNGALCGGFRDCPQSAHIWGDFIQARMLPDGRVLVALPDVKGVIHVVRIG